MLENWQNPDAPSRPVFKYLGSKYRIAPWVLSFFPDHKIYVEPFCGTASVLMQKRRSKAEIINDINDDIINVFKVLRDENKAGQLKELLYLTPYSKEEYIAAHNHKDNESDVEMARKTIIRSFMGGGTGSISKSRCGFDTRAYSKDFKNKASTWANYQNVLPLFTERLQGVIIEKSDAFQIMKKFDTPHTLYYIDPPYMPETWSKECGKCYSKILNNMEHEKLLDIIKQLKGSVIISGYNNDLYIKQLQEWEVHTKVTRNQRNQERIEYLWLSPNIKKNKRTLFDLL